MAVQGPSRQINFKASEPVASRVRPDPDTNIDHRSCSSADLPSRSSVAALRESVRGLRIVAHYEKYGLVNLTFTVSRTNREDGTSTALVWIEDSFESNASGTYVVEFAGNSSRATITLTVPDDGLSVADRKVRVRVSDVRSEGVTEDELTNNTFSADWDAVSVTNTTP